MGRWSEGAEGEGGGMEELLRGQRVLLAWIDRVQGRAGGKKEPPTM